jgi:hypothetical protein
LIGNPLLFVSGAAHVKSIRTEWDVDREPLTFFMCWLIDHACDQEYAPCVDRGHSCSWAKLQRAPLCVETLAALRGPWGHALKAEQVMPNMIMILKADCPKIQ